MIVYKIRNRQTGKFLEGTPAYNCWDKEGRIFGTLGKLRSFITHTLKYRIPMDTWEIIEFELTELNVKGVHEIIKPKKLMELLKQ